MLKKVTAAFLAALLALAAGCSSDRESASEPTDDPETAEETAEPEPEPTAEERAAEHLASMSLEEKAAQMIFAGMWSWNGAPFTEVNEETAAMFEKFHFGGLCLFADSFTSDSRQVASMMHGLQKAALSSSDIPMFIAADEEGGSVARLACAAGSIGNMALAATGSTQTVYNTASMIGEQMKALGLNTDFAPVADVNSNPANSAIGIRSFSDDPSAVARYVSSYAEGLAENGIVSSLKHFPGHGDTDTDSHTGLPLVDKTKEELFRSDLVPFAETIRAGYKDMVMTAHIQFPQIETETYTSIYDGASVTLPATLSKSVLTSLLREELGFNGVIITDSMIMDAIAVHFDPMDALALAVNAGADMILIPVNLSGTQSIAEMDNYMQRFTGLIENGTIPMERIDESVLRILTLKYEKGIMDADYSDEAYENSVADIDRHVNTKAQREAQIEAADMAATVITNNDALPLKAEDGMRVLMVGMNQSQANAFGYAFNRLQEAGIIPEGTSGTVINEEWGENYYDVWNAIAETDVLIISDAVYNGGLYPMRSNTNALTAFAKTYGVTVIAISTYLPYDIPLIENADAVMAVYNYKGISDCDENFNPSGSYCPNLIGAMDVIFNKAKPQGRLPVSLPAAENGALSKTDIAYTKGTGLSW